MSLPNCYYKRFARLMLPLNYHFVSEIYNTTMDPGNFFPSVYCFSLLLQFIASVRRTKTVQEPGNATYSQKCCQLSLTRVVDIGIMTFLATCVDKEKHPVLPLGKRDLDVLMATLCELL